jgi:hypothetical protein
LIETESLRIDDQKAGRSIQAVSPDFERDLLPREPSFQSFGRVMGRPKTSFVLVLGVVNHLRGDVMKRGLHVEGLNDFASHEIGLESPLNDGRLQGVGLAQGSLSLWIIGSVVVAAFFHLKRPGLRFGVPAGVELELASGLGCLCASDAVFLDVLSLGLIATILVAPKIGAAIIPVPGFGRRAENNGISCVPAERVDRVN